MDVVVSVEVMNIMVSHDVNEAYFALLCFLAKFGSTTLALAMRGAFYLRRSGNMCMPDHLGCRVKDLNEK